MVLQLLTVGLALSMAPAPKPMAATPVATKSETPKPTKKPAVEKPAAMAANRPQTSQVHEHEQRMIERMNAERRRFRLRPLRLDFGLMFSARRHARWMSRSGNLQHTTAPVGENIAMGQRSTAEVTQDWMNSPGHRANMLHTGYSRVGAAAHRTQGGRTYWVLQFKQ